MTTAMNILRQIARARRARSIRIDARILRDIGLTGMAVEFGAMR